MLDRQIRSIQREEDKVKLTLKQSAKKGERDVCVILAKEIIRSRKAVNRIKTSQAQLNSVILHMNQQAANLRVAGALQKSSEVMVAMNRLIKLPEISQTMQELSREMMRAGIIDELMEETLETMTDDPSEDMEEEIQAEVDKVLFELTAGKLGEAPAAPLNDSLSLPNVPEASTASISNPEEEEQEMAEMKRRLEALKS